MKSSLTARHTAIQACVGLYNSFEKVQYFRYRNVFIIEFPLRKCDKNGQSAAEMTQKLSIRCGNTPKKRKVK